MKYNIKLTSHEIMMLAAILTRGLHYYLNEITDLRQTTTLSDVESYLEHVRISCKLMDLNTPHSTASGYKEHLSHALNNKLKMGGIVELDLHKLLDDKNDC